jgi:hypothetical protein
MKCGQVSLQLDVCSEVLFFLKQKCCILLVVFLKQLLLCGVCLIVQQTDGIIF